MACADVTWGDWGKYLIYLTIFCVFYVYCIKDPNSWQGEFRNMILYEVVSTAHDNIEKPFFDKIHANTADYQYPPPPSDGGSRHLRDGGTEIIENAMQSSDDDSASVSYSGAHLQGDFPSDAIS